MFTPRLCIIICTIKTYTHTHTQKKKSRLKRVEYTTHASIWPLTPYLCDCIISSISVTAVTQAWYIPPAASRHREGALADGTSQRYAAHHFCIGATSSRNASLALRSHTHASLQKVRALLVHGVLPQHLKEGTCAYIFVVFSDSSAKHTHTHTYEG
jgi:hypothetical protein